VEYFEYREDKKMKRLRTVFCGVVIACFSFMNLASCATAPKQPEDPYYADTITDFSQAALSNGIPVIFKKNPASQICVVQLVIDGGTPLVSRDDGGLEDVTLNLMLHGSGSYPYAVIQKLSYDESFSFSSSSGRDYSVAGFRCIKKSFDRIWPVFADSIRNPVFAETDFKIIMTEAAESVKNTQNDPSSLLMQTVKDLAYTDHPYASSDDVTERSLNTITLEKVRAHYAEMMNAARLSIVVTGNFSEAEIKPLVARIDESFGSIERRPFSRPAIPPLKVTGSAVKVPCRTAGDTGYAAGYFACPSRDDPAYISFAIATMYLDDILFARVREQHGAVYSIGTGVLSGRTSLGIISVYKATEQAHLKEYIEDAVNAFPDEKGIEEKLDQYKNKYITTLFETSQNAAGVAGNIIASLEYYGAFDAYLHRSAQVQAVTAAQVAAAYRRYLAQKPEAAENGRVNPVRWVVVSGPETVAQFNF
jgi:zinc protease